MTRDGQRLVLLLQVLDFFLAQLHFQRPDQVRQLLDTRSADDGRGDLRKDPGEGDLPHGHALALCEFFDAAMGGMSDARSA